MFTGPDLQCGASPLRTNLSHAVLTDTLNTVRVQIRQTPIKKFLVAAGINSMGKRLYERIILSRQRHITTVLGHRLTFHVTSHEELFSIDDLHGEHEFMQRMLDASRPDDIWYDVGANIGMVSLLVADQQRGTRLKVYAFEPEPHNVEHLRTNAELNGLSAQIAVVPKGLGARSQRVCLFVEGEVGTGQHTIVSETAHDRDAIEIELITGDDHASTTGDRPSVIKIDIEGAEMEALMGCEGLIREGAIREVFVEVHINRIFTPGFRTDADVRSWLESRGFALAWSQQRRTEVLQHYRRLGR